MYSINQLRLIGFSFIIEGEIFWFINPSGTKLFVIEDDTDFNEIKYYLIENELVIT